MKKLIAVMLLLAVSIFSIFATARVSAQANGGCSYANNYMACEITSEGCHHRTCTDNQWQDWVSFSDDENGSYQCKKNNNGGGEKCVFVRGELIASLISKGLPRYLSAENICN